MKKWAGIVFIFTFLILLSSCALWGDQNNSAGELEYALNDDGESYSVVGFGTWQGTKLVIPREHNGLPVTIIGEAAFCDEYRILPIPENWDEFDNRKPSVMITEVVIPNSVKTIGARAFLCCNFLETVTLPDSLTTIGEGAFLDCPELKNIDIPSSVKTIGEGAFALCTSLVNIHIPASVTSIELGAFMGCTSLGKIEVEKVAAAIGKPQCASGVR